MFILSVWRKTFSLIQLLDSRADLEEERRLFYVALTRAEQKLHPSFAENRYRWGNLTISEPSRFIDEIDSGYIAYPTRVNLQKLHDASPAAHKGVPLVRKNLKKINNLQQSPDAALEAGTNEPCRADHPGSRSGACTVRKGKGDQCGRCRRQPQSICLL